MEEITSLLKETNRLLTEILKRLEEQNHAFSLPESYAPLSEQEIRSRILPVLNRQVSMAAKGGGLNEYGREAKK